MAIAIPYTPKPVLLTSILPFGIVKNGDDVSYRFSLVLDLEPLIPETSNQKDYYELVGRYAFVLDNFVEISQAISRLVTGERKGDNYGLQVFPVASSSETNVLPAAECFPQVFNRSRSTATWDLLLATDRQRSAKMDASFARELFAPEPSPLAGAKIEMFRDLNDPTRVQGKLVGLQQQLTANGVAGLSSQKAGFQSLMATSVETLADVAHSDAVLRGINEFAVAQNRRQAAYIANGDNIEERIATASLSQAPDTVIETFSFINSNPILQRLFSTTIDFQIPAKDWHARLPGYAPFAIGINFPEILPDFTYRHLFSEMLFHSDSNSGSVIVMGDPSFDRSYTAVSYDRGAVLKGKSDLKGKFESIQAMIDNAKTESERYEINQKLNSINSSALTRGMTLYSDTDESATFQSVAANTAKGSTSEGLKEIDVSVGFRVGVAVGSDRTAPLGRRSVKLIDQNNSPIDLPDDFIFLDSPLANDTGAHSLVEESDGNGGTRIAHKVIISSAVANWDGQNTGLPNVFSSPEDDTNFRADTTEGSTSAASRLITQRFSEIFSEESAPMTARYSGAMKHSRVAVENKEKIRLISESAREEVKQIFGKIYQLRLAPEYRNGWGPPYECTKYPTEFKFKRNEVVKPVELYLRDTLVREEADPKTGLVVKKPMWDRVGESLHHMVIRNYSGESMDAETKTDQESVRYVLPPAISFQQALWHGKIFDIHKNEGRSASYSWYMRHHFPAFEGAPKRNKDGEVIKNKFYTGDEVYEHSTSMRDYFGESWFWSGDDWIINYLPDPLMSGFRLEFFRDKNYRIRAAEYEKYEQGEYYFSGDYPRIKAWRIVIGYHDGKSDLVEKEGSRTVRVRLERGSELFVRARTILADEYEDQLETFGNYNEFTKYGGNDILTPPLGISTVHATQRPLITPRLRNTLECKKPAQDEMQVSMKYVLDFEQLCVHPTNQGIAGYLPDMLPTGMIELYSKCAEYSDDPRRLVTANWNPTMPINKVALDRFESRAGETRAVFETAIKIDEQLDTMPKSLNRTSNEKNERKNYSADVSATFGARSHHFVEKTYWVKNKSRFTGYFSPNPKDPEQFNKNSDQPFVVRILNNKKPAPPSVADRNMTLVSTIDETKTKKRTTRTIRLRRIRLYLNRGRLSSGNGERLGIVVNEPKGKYNNHLVARRQVSRAGRDIVSDRGKPFDGFARNDEVLLTKANFVIRDPVDLTYKTQNTLVADLESFYPEYVEELGLMTYLPKFDTALNLWYVDIELDINDDEGNELHTAFVQFGLVHYQEFSEIYKIPVEDITTDCRISDVEMSRFIYVMASRTITYDEISSREFSITVLADQQSSVDLAHTGLKTRFFAFEEKKDGFRWTPVQETPGGGDNIIELLNGETLPIKLSSSSRRRITVVETEHRRRPNTAAEAAPTLVSQVIDNKQHRVVLINLFDPNTTN